MISTKHFISVLFFIATAIQSTRAFLMQSIGSSSTLKYHVFHAHKFDGEVVVERTYTSSEKEDEDPITSSHEIKYAIHNKMHLSSQQAAPMVVLHGGPGVPVDYLLPLSDVIPYRSIIFYDQLGCGRSQGPDEKTAYSIESSLDDLELILRKIGLRKFHLYGQSFGGILAFEYIKRISERGDDHDEPKCLSVILSSSPCDVDQVESVAGDLIAKLMENDPDESTIMERFRLNHTCQIAEKPQALVDAYEHAGKPGVWRGTESIRGWKATKPESESSKRMPSCMIMRGEHDFVTADCVEGWKDAFNHKFVRFKELEDLSHHGLMENGPMYGEMVDSYFAEYD